MQVLPFPGLGPCTFCPVETVAACPHASPRSVRNRESCSSEPDDLQRVSSVASTGFEEGYGEETDRAVPRRGAGPPPCLWHAACGSAAPEDSLCNKPTTRRSRLACGSCSRASGSTCAN